jgi:8-oxo-dGTP pyrophosphatase MutT (NUDIX family)
MWECVGGSVTAGEDSLTGALREAFEEVGIKLDPDCGRVVFSRVRDVIGGKRFGDIMDVWLFDFDGDADLDAATTDEVANARWMRRDEIRALYDEGKLVHTLDYFFTDFNE